MALRAHYGRRARSAEDQEQSRAVGALLREVESAESATQVRVIAEFLEAMLSTSADSSKVCLSDLDYLDDAQYENVILTLRYVRRTRRAWRAEETGRWVDGEGERNAPVLREGRPK